MVGCAQREVLRVKAYHSVTRSWGADSRVDCNGARVHRLVAGSSSFTILLSFERASVMRRRV